MTPKAIFFDIDGTLLSFETHKVSPGTIMAFDELRRLGIRTFISSGRPKALLPRFPLQFDGYILMNGGLCYMGDEVLLRNPIPQEDCIRWLDLVRANHMSTMAFSEEEIFINALDDTCREINRQMGIGEAPVKSLEEISQLSIFQFIAVQPKEQDAGLAELLPHCRLPRWHPLFSDLIPADSSKAVGIDCIIHKLGIRQEDTIAFGDGMNDIEMLQFVGTGVAMGNASDAVKQKAGFVTTSVDDEGILHALKTLKII